MKNKIIIASLFIFFAGAVMSAPRVSGKNKPYYTGDAIRYNNATIIGSTNMDKIELFKVVDSRIVKASEIVSPRHQFSGFDSFYDVIFNIEDGDLFAYAVDGIHLYKYDVSDPFSPRLERQVKNNANNWDWMLGLEKTGNNVVTVSKSGVQIWNHGMDIIDYHKIPKSKDFYNVAFSADGNHIYNVEDGIVQVYDVKAREFLPSLAVETEENHNRKVYGENKAVYLADDIGMKKIDLAGNTVSRFNFTGSLGYDVVPSVGGNHLYFSDGVGIVKVAKSDLKPAAWAYTGNLGGSESWAMGLKVLNANGQDQLVVFNNSNILVLNADLKKVDSYRSSEKSEKAEIKEAMFLRLDRNRAAANSQVLLSGGGFGVNEALAISFGGKATNIAADQNGRFSQVLQVPEAPKGGLDIKVTGQASKLHYSIGFIIE